MGRIEELLKDKYKLRIPPTVYYDLLADVVEIEEQELNTGHWKTVPCEETLYCSECNLRLDDEQTYIPLNFCPNCGAKMAESEET